MAITKQFQAHTELKAEDLNELISQTNDYIVQEGNKKPDKVDITGYETSGAILPLSSYYTHGGKPTYSRIGTYDSTDFLAIIVATWGNSNPNTLIYLYTKDDQNLYRFNSTFYSNDDDLTNMERYVVAMVAGTPVSYTRNGLMTSDDKMTFDDMVTEVFPLTVGVVSSNAGTREVGSSTVGAVTPTMVLSITRKGADVASSAVVTPSSGNVGSDNKTITDSPMHSGTKTINVSVVQGGQTKTVSAQWQFMNYVYGGQLDAAPADAAAVKAQLESWGSSHGVLSNKTNSTAITSSGAIALPATKYYLFAVKGNVTLVVRDAATDGLITGATTGNGLSVARVNGSGNDNYSWVIVPASSNSWNFKITNS